MSGAENKKTKGYYYLWHLVAAGVLIPAEVSPKLSNTVWDRLHEKGCLTPSKVAMIDVGCNFDHPNLKWRVDPGLSIDFSLNRFGTRFSEMAGQADKEAVSNFAGLDVSGLTLDQSSSDAARLDELVTELVGSTGAIRHQGDVERLYSSHGTAVAGLIVGGPEILSPDATPTQAIIPYFGVDPCSDLFSIRTGFDDDPLQFISALLYAWNQSPDVIVMPRGLPDPDLGYMSPKEDFLAELQHFANRDNADLLARIQLMKASQEDSLPWEPQRPQSNKQLWGVVTQLLKAISMKIPIVCAAGNDGESQLIYPANLADQENGIIAVGAVTADGVRSGYANYGDGLSLVAPADDMEVFNQHQVRDRKRMFDYLGNLTDGLSQFMLSEQGLLTTDIPGSFGYDEGVDDPFAPVDPASTEASSGNYTLFGGTSGAAALVAGVIALVRRAERGADGLGRTRDGCDIKSLLSRTACKAVPSWEAPKELRADPMNSAEEESDMLGIFFGQGLINAEKAIEDVLREVARD